jgi:hypothetical protein
MISDVMFDAIQRVNQYRRDFPAAYDDPEVSEAIDRAMIAMQALQTLLDTPPMADEELAAEAATTSDPRRN